MEETQPAAGVALVRFWNKTITVTLDASGELAEGQEPPHVNNVVAAIIEGHTWLDDYGIDRYKEWIDELPSSSQATTGNTGQGADPGEPDSPSVGGEAGEHTLTPGGSGIVDLTMPLP